MKSNEVAEAAKKKYLEAKQAVEDCQKLIAELTKKYDLLQEETTLLAGKVDGLEKDETEAYDNFVIRKITEKEFEKIKNECQALKNKHVENQRMLEALHRGIKRVESDFIKLNNSCDIIKRDFWKAVAESIRREIPVDVIENIQTLFVCGSQCGQTRQFILDSLFPNLSTGEFQGTRSRIMEKFEITD